jgi:hypothetical protein
MNDAVHQVVHRSVHLLGERKLLGAQMLRVARRLILDAGKTPGWAGATPLSLPRKPWRSLQPSELGKAQFPSVFPASSKANQKGKEEEKSDVHH